MLLDERQTYYLLMTITRIAEKIEGTVVWTRDFMDVVFDDRLYKAVLESDKHQDALDEVPKTHRSRVARALSLLRERLTLAREFLLKSPPDWLRNVVVADFLYSTDYPASCNHVLKEHIDEMLKYVPTPVERWDTVFYRGNEFRGLILFPDESELKDIEIKSVRDLYEDLVKRLLLKNIAFLPERHAVRIYDYEIAFPRSEYYRVLKKYRKSDIIVDMLKEDMGGVLKELGRLGTVTLTDESLKVELTPEVISSAYGSHGLNVSRAYVAFELDPSAGRGKDGKVALMYNGRLFTVTDLMRNICFTGNCPEAKKFEFGRYEDIPSVIQYMLDKSREVLLFTKHIESAVIEAGKKRGFELPEHYGVEYPYSFAPYGKIKMVKSIDDKGNVYVTTVIDYIKGEATIDYEVAVWIRRNVPDEVKEEFLQRAREAGIARDFKMEEKQRKYWEIRVEKEKLDLANLDKVFEEAEKVLEIASNVYESYVVESKRKREEIRLTPEQYVAIYLTNVIKQYEALSVERLSGRPELVMYSVVARIASRYGVQGQPSRDGTLIVHGLFEAGYITVDKDMHVYINGKRYVDLLSGLAPWLTPTTLMSYEEQIASKLIAYHLYSKTGNRVEELYRMGLFSDKVIQTLIATREIYIMPDEMATSIGGKPAWHHLSPATKKMYLDSLYLMAKARIYFDPALSEVFKDFIRDIEEELVSSGDASIVTRIVVERMPKLIGLPGQGNISIVSERNLYGIDAGTFLVQVYRVNPANTDENAFVVYRKDTKVGFLFKGRTLTDALSEAALRYSRIYNVYKNIEEEYSKSGKVGNNYALYYHYYGEYKVPYLSKGGKVVFIDERAPEIVRKKEEEAESVVA